MIEMLMAAFILAIGILGLTMLQVYSLRSQTSGKSIDIAVQVAQRILDEAEMLGRNSVVTSRAGVTPPTLVPNYFGTAALTQYFDTTGGKTAAASYFTAVITPTTAAGTGIVAPIAGLGGIAMLSVTVTWTEAVAGTQARTRNLTLNRRINYATS